MKTKYIKVKNEFAKVLVRQFDVVSNSIGGVSTCGYPSETFDTVLTEVVVDVFSTVKRVPKKGKPAIHRFLGSASGFAVKSKDDPEDDAKAIKLALKRALEDDYSFVYFGRWFNTEGRRAIWEAVNKAYKLW